MWAVFWTTTVLALHHLQSHCSTQTNHLYTTKPKAHVLLHLPSRGQEPSSRMWAGCCLLIAKRGIWIARRRCRLLRGVAALLRQRNQVGPGTSAAVVLLPMVAQTSHNTLNHIQYIAQAEMS